MGQTNRVTKALFRFSDACAWVVLFFSALAAVSFPFVEFVPRNRPAESELLFASGLSLLVAIGAYQLMRRRLFGLPLVLLLPVAFGFHTNLFATFAYLLSATAAFGAPFVRAFLEARASAAKAS
jgi:hypothetical protein